MAQVSLSCVQAADASRADVLYSEDLAHGQIYGSVRVVNPLLERPPRTSR